MNPVTTLPIPRRSVTSTIFATSIAKMASNGFRLTNRRRAFVPFPTSSVTADVVTSRMAAVQRPLYPEGTFLGVILALTSAAFRVVPRITAGNALIREQTWNLVSGAFTWSRKTTYRVGHLIIQAADALSHLPPVGIFLVVATAPLYLTCPPFPASMGNAVSKNVNRASLPVRRPTTAFQRSLYIPDPVKATALRTT